MHTCICVCIRLPCDMCADITLIVLSLTAVYQSWRYPTEAVLCRTKIPIAALYNTRWVVKFANGETHRYTAVQFADKFQVWDVTEGMTVVHKYSSTLLLLIQVGLNSSRVWQAKRFRHCWDHAHANLHSQVKRTSSF